jgi:hypothetical protein
MRRAAASAITRIDAQNRQRATGAAAFEFNKESMKSGKTFRSLFPAFLI